MGLNGTVNDISMSVRHLSKKFCKNLRRSMLYGLRDIAKSTAGVRPDNTYLRKDEFWAVEDISFELEKGQVCGIVGPNGSGKTTLLRVLAQIFPPDNGEVVMVGRIASLLTLGAGFHPHMTVRENIYINGTILGMTRREIDRKLDEIISFSGIADFVSAPVAALSDGMYVRLGFSIALAMKPDIFLIDEILAVGDREFREKCVEEITRRSLESIILFVSHSMDMVKRVCNRIIVLDKGRIALESSDVAGGIEYYDSLQRN